MLAWSTCYSCAGREQQGALSWHGVATLFGRHIAEGLLCWHRGARVIVLAQSSMVFCACTEQWVFLCWRRAVGFYVLAQRSGAFCAGTKQ